MNKSKFKPGWYVIYTRSNYEKKIYNELKMNFKVYLPLKKTLKQWSDRKKEVEEPLYKSYVFIYLKNAIEQQKSLYVKGVNSYVNISGKPAMVTDKEIEIIKLFTGDFSNIELASYEIKVGEKRKINFGPFTGYDCFIINYDGKDKVMVSIDSLKSCISAEINKVHLAEFC